MKKLFWLLLPFLLGCPKPVPPEPPTPPEPPASCCNVPGPEEPGWQSVATKPPYNELFLSEAKAKVGNVCGAVPEESLSKLADALVAANLCAAKWADAIIILRPDGYWEQWHSVAFTDGCWTQEKSYVGTWVGPQMKGCQ